MKLFIGSLSGDNSNICTGLDINSKEYIICVIDYNYNLFNSSITIDANDYEGANDSETIQNAMDYAATVGRCTVELKYNNRTNSSIWLINTAIQIPNDTKIIINGVNIKQDGDIVDNIFRPAGWIENAANPNGVPQLIPKGTNIHIAGVNGGKIEGGTGRSTVGGWHNPLIHFSNTEIFSVRDLFVDNPFRFHILNTFQTNLGYYKNIECGGVNINQDGIHIAKSVSRIVIDGVTGSTGDDGIAINGFLPDIGTVPGDNQNAEYPEGNWDYPSQTYSALGSNFSDIHHIYISNINFTNPYRTFRLICTSGLSVHHIYYENISQVQSSNDSLIQGAFVLFGTVDSPVGYMNNIYITNLSVPDGMRPFTNQDIIGEDWVINGLYSTVAARMPKNQINLVTSNLAVPISFF